MQPASLAPEKYRKLSGSMLKLLAVAAMLCDHTAKRIFVVTNPSLCLPLESFGRIAFPIFCFLLVEGFVHTHDRRSYGIRLAAFALISEVPFDLCRKMTPVDPAYQNVFFTLLLSFVGLCAYEELRDQPALRAASVIGLALVSMGLLCDYGPRGYAMVLMLYVLRDHALAKTTLGCCILTATWRAGLAFIPINLYNGQRGFVGGPVLKYAFYAFYPVHLLVLWLLRLQLGV